MNKIFLNFYPYFGFCAGFPAAAYAAYAAGRGYSGYPSFGLPYPTGNINFNTLHNFYSNNNHPNTNNRNHNNHNNNNYRLIHPLINPCQYSLMHQHHPFDHGGASATHYHHHYNYPMHL